MKKDLIKSKRLIHPDEVFLFLLGIVCAFSLAIFGPVQLLNETSNYLQGNGLTNLNMILGVVGTVISTCLSCLLFIISRSLDHIWKWKSKLAVLFAVMLTCELAIILTACFVPMSVACWIMFLMADISLILFFVSLFYFWGKV